MRHTWSSRIRKDLVITYKGGMLTEYGHCILLRCSPPLPHAGQQHCDHRGRGGRRGCVQGCCRTQAGGGGRPCAHRVPRRVSITLLCFFLHVPYAFIRCHLSTIHVDMHVQRTGGPPPR